MIQSQAGEGIGASDDEYRSVGAEIVEDPKDIFDHAEMIVKVKEPQANERAMLSSGKFCLRICIWHPILIKPAISSRAALPVSLMRP